MYDARAAGAMCDVCPLNKQTAVPPEGPSDADIVIVGEAPGMHEIRRGRPFVGPSGVMLDDLLREVGVRRDRVWVSNGTLCRPEVPGVDGAKRYDFRLYLAWLRNENKKLKKWAKDQNEPFTPIPSPITCCAPRLGKELTHFEKVAKDKGQPNGAVVIPMGNIALKAVTGFDGIMARRGSPMKLELK